MMATFYKFLGYTIFIVSGLISLYGGWVYLVVNVGWVDPIIFLLFSPLEIAIVPFILAFQGQFQLLIITYGGAVLGYFFIASAERLEQKSSPKISAQSTSYKKSEGESTKKQLSKSDYQPGEEVETNIVGVTFEGRQKIVDRLNVGDNVFLQREPDNPYDPNAIKVLAEKHTMDEQEQINLEITNKYDTLIKSVIDHNQKLFKEKMQLLTMSPSSQERDDKIAEIDIAISQLGEKRRELNKERTELSVKKYEKVQIGYIDKELASHISPIFDQWASGPVTVVDGKIKMLTGREKPSLTHGLIIRFRLPDKHFLENAILQEMSLYF